MLQKPNVFTTENNKEYRILNAELEANLDNKFNAVVEYMANNKGKKSDEEIDILYAESQKLFHDFNNLLKEIKYDFYFSKDQIEFLKNLLVEELEYDVNTAFIAIEIKTLMDSINLDEFSNDELRPLLIDATEITFIYHLISPYKVKGLNKNTFIFTDILRKIGASNKLINFYDTLGKDLSTEVMEWVALFDENVSIEQPKLDYDKDLMS